VAEKKNIEFIKQALKAAKERKFTESVELAINLKDVDLSIPKNRIDEEISLPKGRGKQIKVAVFGSGELAITAKKTADQVIGPEQLNEFAGDKKSAKKLANSHDFFIAEAPMMPTIGKTLGIALGPRGKMPKPIPPSADPTAMITMLKTTVRVRSKERRTFHVHLGIRTMSPEDLADNLEAVLKRIEAKLERGRQNIASAYIKTTMGPAVRIL